MKLSVGLQIRFSSREACEGAYVSLKPDNVGIPQSLRFGFRRRGSVLRVDLSTDEDPKALASILDDILESISLHVSAAQVVA